MRILGVLVLSLAFLAPGGCGPSSALARNTATANEMLQRTGSPDFANASTAERVALRHTPSGMVCVAPGDGAFDFGVFPASATNPGAHCSTSSNGVAVVYMAVQFGEGVSLDTAFQDAVNATAGRANARPWPGAASDADRSSPEGLPHFRIARFEATIEGRPQYLRVAMSEARGWYIQQIVTAPLESAAAAEAGAGETWRAMLRDFVASD